MPMMDPWELFSSLSSSSRSAPSPSCTAWTPGRSSAARSAGSNPRVTAAFARRSPAAVALALATVYLVWGSTYLAIRVTDRTMPPFLMSSARFLVAGAALYAFASRGRARPTLREWGAAAVVGAALLLVGNGGVAWAETRLDSGFAALIVAIIPLYVALRDRIFFGRRLSTPAVVGLVVGFAGVALLVRPGGTEHVGVALLL